MKVAVLTFTWPVQIGKFDLTVNNLIYGNKTDFFLEWVIKAQKPKGVTLKPFSKLYSICKCVSKCLRVILVDVTGAKSFSASKAALPQRQH